MAQAFRGFLLIAALAAGSIALHGCSPRGDVEIAAAGFQKSATRPHVQMDVTSVAPACTLANQSGGLTSTCVFVEPLTGQVLTSVVNYTGASATSIGGVPVLIVQVPADASDFLGTYGSAGGTLVFSPGHAQLPLDANTNLVAEAGMQLVVIELPANVGPGTYYMYLSYFASSTQIKGLAAAKVTAAGRAFYPTLVPCTTTFADLPLIPVPQTPLATIIDVRTIKAAYAPCAGKVYDFTAATLTVVEYYNAALDHYFITWIPNEIAVLDAGIVIRGWLRTGRTFKAYAAAQTGTSDICRYYIPPAQGDSHFFGRGTAECNATGAAHPNFVLEDPKFMQMILPAAGNCPPGTIPVYRVFSNRLDANHRYAIDRAVRDQMVQAGWLAEGDGPDLVVMCAPA
jgi:hypothetical protein